MRLPRSRIRMMMVMVAATTVPLGVCAERPCVRAEETADDSVAQKQSALMPRPYFEKGRWGYVNAAGQPVIQPQFTEAADFFEQRAAVVGSGKTGYLGPDGSWLIELPKGADPIGRFSEGRAWFILRGKWGCIDPSGRVIVPPSYDRAEEFSDGAAVVVRGRLRRSPRNPELPRYGFVDRDGREMLPLEYRYARRFGDGLAPVMRANARTFEFIDRTGDVAITATDEQWGPGQFVGSVQPFSDGRAMFHLDGSAPAKAFVGFVDLRGKRIGNEDFEGGMPFSEGIAGVRSKQKIGYINKSGSFAISPKYDDGRTFQDGLCAVLTGDSWKYIDRTGKVVVENERDSAPWNDVEAFVNGLARVHVGGRFTTEDGGSQWWQGGAWYYIDRRGKTVFKCREDQKRPVRPSFGRERALSIQE